jgi:hypothetical protein
VQAQPARAGAALDALAATDLPLPVLRALCAHAGVRGWAGAGGQPAIAALARRCQDLLVDTPLPPPPAPAPLPPLPAAPAPAPQAPSSWEQPHATVADSPEV